MAVKVRGLATSLETFLHLVNVLKCLRGNCMANLTAPGTTQSIVDSLFSISRLEIFIR